MGRKEGEVLPPDVVPCGSFQMSDRFREWAVAEMRKEVLGQVRAAGLDRMAMLKARKGAGAGGTGSAGADGGADGGKGGA
jgi:hypothetical protein